MPRRLYLVRHGETEANRLKIIQGQDKQQPGYGACLNPKGKSQAVLLGVALADVEFQLVCSSPARRTIDTAHLILTFNRHDWYKTNRTMGNALFVKRGLLELDQGNFEGMNVKDVETRYPEFYSLYGTKPSQITFPQGESLLKAKERVGRVIDQIFLEQSADTRNILAVSHGGVMALILIHIFKLDLDTMFHAIRHHSCGLSIIEWEKSDSPRIICLNDISHLGYEHIGRLRD